MGAFWEVVVDDAPSASFVERLSVPGGWLYKVVETAWDEHPSGENRRYANMGLCFVPLEE